MYFPYLTIAWFAGSVFCFGKSVTHSPALIIGGNFTLNGERVNMAQYDITTGGWSNHYQPVLYLYGETNGVVWDMTVNNSDARDELIVVGSFDTISQTSQSQYCGVGRWNGVKFDKLGAGLCSHSDTMAEIKVLASVIGQNDELFVGGTFESRVWDGKKFATIYNLARFYSPSESWLPLGGQLGCSWCVASVYSLAWDPLESVLYIAGMFDTLDSNWIPAGLAMWDETNGIRPFIGGGLSMDMIEYDGLGISITWDIETESLFVAGYFTHVNSNPCVNIAVWNRRINAWVCLYEARHGIAGVTSMMMDHHWLYVAGWAATDADWQGWDSQSPYAIIRSRLRGFDSYIAAKLKEQQQGQDMKATIINTQVKRGQSTNSTHKYPPPVHHSRAFHDFWKAQTSQSAKTASSSNSDNDDNNDGDEWKAVWQWLPGFTGGNGPIFQVASAKLGHHYSLFIAGAFNNYPPVVLWERNGSDGGTITGIGKDSELNGLVTSIAQMLTPAPSPIPDEIKKVTADNVFLILSICILVGVGIGVLIAYSCRARRYTRINDDAPVEDGIPLKTLNMSLGEADVNFRECFQRAMRARHLPTQAMLLMIDPAEIVLNRIIGEGSYGRVWSGFWRSNTVAVKEFVFAQAAVSGGSVQRSSIVEEIVGEAGIMSCLRHPKVLQLYGCSVTIQAIWIVSELCSRGSLRMVLNDQSIQLSTATRLRIAMDVADAMVYLHSRHPPVIHRDLKSHNIFLHESSPGQFTAKLGDWGSARAVALSGQRTMTHGIGTACWLAPEVIEHAKASKASDVFAFGIVLWEIATREEVYEGLSAAQIIVKVANEGLRPKVPEDCTWGDIMRKCWAQQAMARPSFEDILEILSALCSDSYQQQTDDNNYEIV